MATPRVIKRPDVLSLSLSLSLFRNDRYLGFVEPTLAAAPVLQLLPVPGVVLLRGLHHRVQGKPLPSTAFAPPKRFARTLTRRFPLSPKKRAVRVWPERERPGRDPDGGPILVAVGGASSVVDGVQRQPEGKCECTLYSSPSPSLSLFLSGRRRRRRRRRKCADCNTFLEGSDPPGLLAPHLLREHPGLLLLLLRPDGHQALRQRDQHHGFGHAPAGARHRRLRGKWSINPRLLTTRCPRATPDIPHLSLSSWRTNPCRPPRSCAASRESTTWKNTRLRWRRFTQTEIPRRRLGGGHCNDKTDSRVDLAPPECTKYFWFCLS